MEENTWLLIYFIYLNTWNVLKYFSYAVITVLLCIIIRVLLYELSYYLAVKSFSQIPQVGIYYAPFKGNTKLFLENDGIDSLGRICEEWAKYSDKKMIVQNVPGSAFGTICVVLTSSEAVKDFIYKELTHSIKKIPQSPMQDFDLGLITQNGGEALRQRAIFSDLFLYDRMQILQGPMYKIIENHVEEFIKSKNIIIGEFKQVDLRDCLGKVMIDWISQLLFGFDSGDNLKIDLDNHQDVLNGEYRSGSLKNTKKTNLVKITAFLR